MSQLNVIAVKTHYQWICTCNNQVHREFKRPFFAPSSVLDKSSSQVLTSLSSSSLCKRLEYKCPRCFAISMRLAVLKSCHLFSTVVGGAVASWLMYSYPDRAVRGQILAGEIVWCFWARHLISQCRPLSPPSCVMSTGDLMLGITLLWTSTPSRGEYKYSWSLQATETGISSGHLAHMQTSPFYLHIQCSYGRVGESW